MSYGPPSGPHNPGGYGPPPPGPYSGGQPAGQPPKNYLWMNILGLFGCTVIGIIGLIFALQVNSKWSIGDYAGAESSANTAKIMGIISLIGFILGAIFWVIYIVFFVVLAASSATYSTY
ncbi:CD225/dispanin family protein [Actinorugispora endophytica]|uniref:Interferon-induced transmembrane protein n=1 Tax=Actinorugispora endophytica TaxID=1605990 RepID=A0A4R6UQN3_9ACTN|nr:CD225/dispanin family protein [Actinorugispora endophytica]TDQ48516.1 interferon-induced transmembrane protein [Actinorugispora endophytica]